MLGPFAVIFEDYFGLTHEFHAWANTTEQAIRQAKWAYKYPMKIIDVYVDYDVMLDSDGMFSSISRWLNTNSYI